MRRPPSIPRSVPAPLTSLVLLVLAVTLLAGCGGDDDPESGPTGAASSDPSEPADAGSPQEADGPCDLLDVDQVEALAGAPIRTANADETGQGLPQCTWGSLEGAGVTVGRVPASAWAAVLPGLIDTVRQADPADLPLGKEDLAQLEEAAALVDDGGDVPDDQACDLWQSLSRIGGNPPGSTTSLSLFPSSAAPELIAAQGCEDGTFATLTVGRPDLARRVDEVAAAAQETLDRLLAG